MSTETVPADRAAWLKGPAMQMQSARRQGRSGVAAGVAGRAGRRQRHAGRIAPPAVRRLPAFDRRRLSRGQIAARGRRSPAITAALEYMRRGELVPDETVVDLVRERKECLRCPGGFLLDGFPRTVAQAEALAGMLAELGMKLDAVIDFALPIEEIVSRLSGRRTCADCKAVFHVTGRPPKVEGVCDNCGGQLVQREDDRPEAVRVRMDAYQRSTSPLTDYFRKQGLLDRGGRPRLARRDFPADAWAAGGVRR